jgi:hypothetical protein
MFIGSYIVAKNANSNIAQELKRGLIRLLESDDIEEPTNQFEIIIGQNSVSVNVYHLLNMIPSYFAYEAQGEVISLVLNYGSNAFRFSAEHIQIIGDNIIENIISSDSGTVQKIVKITDNESIILYKAVATLNSINFSFVIRNVFESAILSNHLWIARKCLQFAPTLFNFENSDWRKVSLSGDDIGAQGFGQQITRPLNSFELTLFSSFGPIVHNLTEKSIAFTTSGEDYHLFKGFSNLSILHELFDFGLSGLMTTKSRVKTTAELMVNCQTRNNITTEAAFISLRTLIFWFLSHQWTHILAKRVQTFPFLNINYENTLIWYLRCGHEVVKYRNSENIIEERLLSDAADEIWYRLRECMAKAYYKTLETYLRDCKIEAVVPEMVEIYPLFPIRKTRNIFGLINAQNEEEVKLSDFLNQF